MGKVTWAAYFGDPTYIVRVGEWAFEMSSRADQPNGVNMYVGWWRRSDVPGLPAWGNEIDARQVEPVDPRMLPHGTRRGIARAIREYRGEIDDC